MNEEELEVTEYEVSASSVGEGVDLFLAEDPVSDYSMNSDPLSVVIDLNFVRKARILMRLSS